MSQRVEKEGWVHSFVWCDMLEKTKYVDPRMEHRMTLTYRETNFFSHCQLVIVSAIVLFVVT